MWYEDTGTAGHCGDVPDGQRTGRLKASGRLVSKSQKRRNLCQIIIYYIIF